MPLGGRGQQQLRRVGRPAGDHHDVCGVGLALAVAVDRDLGHGAAARIGVERHRPGVSDQRDVRVLERRANREHLGIRLRVHETREAVAGRRSERRCCGPCRTRSASPRTARGRGDGPGPRGRRRAAGCAARATRPGRDRARWRRARSGPHLVRRAPGTGARPPCNTAPSRRSRSATRVRCRRGGEARRSPLPGGGKAPRRRAWWRRRRSSAPAAGTPSRSHRRTRCPPRCSGCRRTRRRRTSSAARARASPRAPAAGCACRRGQGGARACRRRRRCRSR